MGFETFCECATPGTAAITAQNRPIMVKTGELIFCISLPKARGYPRMQRLPMRLTRQA